jgi:hypothetical protein
MSEFILEADIRGHDKCDANDTKRTRAAYAREPREPKRSREWHTICTIGIATHIQTV